MPEPLLRCGKVLKRIGGKFESFVFNLHKNKCLSIDVISEGDDVTIGRPNWKNRLPARKKIQLVNIIIQLSGLFAVVSWW